MSGVVTSIVVTVAATAYSAYQADKAADKQEDALKEQKRQTIEAAGIQAEQQRKQGAAMQAEARANAAAAGLSLDDTDSTVGVIQEQIKADTGNNVNLIQKQAGWQTTNIQNQINGLPSTGQIATQAGLNAASSSLSIYTNYKNIKDAEAKTKTEELLLARQNFSTSSSNWIQSQGSDFGTIKYDSGASNTKLTLR